jgi:hypothetical protein
MKSYVSVDKGLVNLINNSVSLSENFASAEINADLSK